MKLNVTKERKKIRKYLKKKDITCLDDLRVIFGSASMHHNLSLRKIKAALSLERIVDEYIHQQLNAAIKRSDLEKEVADIVHKFVTPEVYDKFCEEHNNGNELNYKDFLAFSTKMMNASGKASGKDYQHVINLRQKRKVYNEIIHQKRR